MSTVSLTINVPSVDTVLLYYDKIKVYRSSDDINFSEATNPSTRITLVGGQSTYTFVDTMGSSAYFYRVTYFNSLSAVESPQSASQRGDEEPIFNVLTVEDLKNNFLFGLPLQDQAGNPLPDSFFIFYIRSAIKTIERALGISIVKSYVSNERLDYFYRDYQQFIRLQTRKHPIISIDSISLYANNASLVETYDLNWVTTQKNNGMIQIIPTTGQIAFGYSFASWPGLLGYGLGHIPDAFQISYTAGFADGEVPPDIAELVGMQAALGPLQVISDIIYGAGIAQTKVTLDGLATDQKLAVAPGVAVLGARIETYRQQIKERIADLRNSYNGMQIVVV